MIQETNKIFNADVMAKSRKQNHVFARIAYSKTQRNQGRTLQSIGEEIGKGHDIIIYYCIQHEQLYKFDPDYKQKYDLLKKEL